MQIISAFGTTHSDLFLLDICGLRLLFWLKRGESHSVCIGQYAQGSYKPIQRSFHYSALIKYQETLVAYYFPPPW